MQLMLAKRDLLVTTKMKTRSSNVDWISYSRGLSYILFNSAHLTFFCLFYWLLFLLICFSLKFPKNCRRTHFLNFVSSCLRASYSRKGNSRSFWNTLYWFCLSSAKSNANCLRSCWEVTIGWTKFWLIPMPTQLIIPWQILKRNEKVATLVATTTLLHSAIKK